MSGEDTQRVVTFEYIIFVQCSFDRANANVSLVALPVVGCRLCIIVVVVAMSLTTDPNDVMHAERTINDIITFRKTAVGERFHLLDNALCTNVCVWYVLDGHPLDDAGRISACTKGC